MASGFSGPSGSGNNPEFSIKELISSILDVVDGMGPWPISGTFTVWMAKPNLSGTKIAVPKSNQGLAWFVYANLLQHDVYGPAK
jgi:hypothetical protein